MKSLQQETTKVIKKDRKLWHFIIDELHKLACLI